MITIREARSNDASAIAALSSTLGYPAQVEIMQARLDKMLSRADQLVALAEDEHHVVCGWLTAHAFDTLASGFRVQITGLVVSDQHRRMGIGRQLVERAEVWAKSLHAEAVVVFSNIKRTESHSFYPAVGYTNTKTEAVYRKALPKPTG